MNQQPLVDMLSETYDNYLEIITMISNYLKYEFTESNSIIFRAGDLYENFYIILRGKAHILVPQQKSFMMSEKEFSQYLKKLRTNQEIELLNMSINSNMELFQIRDPNERHPTGVEKKHSNDGLLQRKLKSKIVKRTLHYQNNSLTMDFIKELTTIEKKSTIRFGTIKTVFNGLLQFLNKLNPESYDSQEVDDAERKQVKLWIYEPTKVLLTGNYFGESSMNLPNQKRKVTVYSENEGHFGFLDKKSFQKIILEAEEKHRRNSITFLLESEIFSGVDVFYFSQKLYKHLGEQKYTKFDKLISPSESLDYIYFIKNGEFKLSVNVSLLEINNMIVNLDENYKHILTLKYSSEINKKFKSKHNHIIGLFKSCEIFGFDNILLGDKCHFELECLSSKSKVFKISRVIFNSLLKNEPKINTNYTNYIKKQNSFFVDRLLKLRKLIVSKTKQVSLNHTPPPEKEITLISDSTNINISSLPNCKINILVNQKSTTEIKQFNITPTPHHRVVRSYNSPKSEYSNELKRPATSISKTVLSKNKLKLMHSSKSKKTERDESRESNKKEMEKLISIKKNFKNLDFMFNKFPVIPKDEISLTSYKPLDFLMIDDFNRRFNTKNYFLKNMKKQKKAFYGQILFENRKKTEQL